MTPYGARIGHRLEGSELEAAEGEDTVHTIGPIKTNLITPEDRRANELLSEWRRSVFTHIFCIFVDVCYMLPVISQSDEGVYDRSIADNILGCGLLISSGGWIIGILLHAAYFYPRGIDPETGDFPPRAFFIHPWLMLCFTIWERSRVHVGYPSGTCIVIMLAFILWTFLGARALHSQLQILPSLDLLCISSLSSSSSQPRPLKVRYAIGVAGQIPLWHVIRKDVDVVVIDEEFRSLVTPTLTHLCQVFFSPGKLIFSGSKF